MKNLGRVFWMMRDAYRRPFTTKKAVFNLVFWLSYGCFIAWMMWFNKYVMESETWFSFTANVLCMVLAITLVLWSITGVRYRLFVRGFQKKLDPFVKEAMGPEHGIAKLRFSYHRSHLWIADCSCGCGADFLIDNEKGGIFIQSDKPFGAHLEADA